MLYEKYENNPNDFRLTEEGEPEIRTKIKYLQLHMKDAKQQDNEKEMLACTTSLALSSLKLQDYEDAENLLKEQLEKAVELKVPEQERQALTNLGVLARYHGNITAAMDYYSQALEIAVARNEKWSEARLLNNMAIIYETQSNYGEAIELYNKRFTIAEVLSDEDGQIKACSSLGALYHTTGDIQNSLQNYEKVLELLRFKLRVFATLADDAEDSDADDFVDFGDEDEPEEDKEGGGEEDGGKKGGLKGKLPKFLKKKK